VIDVVKCFFLVRSAGPSGHASLSLSLRLLFNEIFDFAMDFSSRYKMHHAPWTFCCVFANQETLANDL
jgi:hypothetical protein